MFKYYVMSVKVKTLLVLMFFTNFVFLNPLRHFSMRSGYRIAPFVFPFQISNIYFQLLFMLGAVYLFSDVPFTQHWNMYRLIRKGRIRWGMEQLSVVFRLTLFYTGANLLMHFGILAKVTTYRAEWGKVLYTLALTNAAEESESIIQFPYVLINEYLPVPALCYAVIITCLCVFFIGLLMFFISLQINRTASILAAMLFLVLPAAVENMLELHDRYIMLSPLSWMNYVSVPEHLPVGRIVAILGGINLLLAAGSILKIRTCEFSWHHEES